jgi:type I restriction enzyme M protein
MNVDTIISRVWSFSTILRDDGVTYGDYLEQLTYLIFLKWQMNTQNHLITGI